MDGWMDGMAWKRDGMAWKRGMGMGCEDREEGGDVDDSVDGGDVDDPVASQRIQAGAAPGPRQHRGHAG